MPIFEYRCLDCGVRYEKLTFSREARPPECPSCHGDQVEKLLSVPSIGRGGAGNSAGAVGPCGTPKSACSSGGFT